MKKKKRNKNSNKVKVASRSPVYDAKTLVISNCVEETGLVIPCNDAEVDSTPDWGRLLRETEAHENVLEISEPFEIENKDIPRVELSLAAMAHLDSPDAQIPVCIEISDADLITLDGNILIRNGEYLYRINITDKTSRLYGEDDEVLFLYFTHPPCRFSDSPEILSLPCISIVGESLHWLFDDIEDMHNRLESIVTYASFSAPRQEWVKRKKEGAIQRGWKEEKSEPFRPFLKKNELEAVFNICRASYSKEIQLKAEDLLALPRYRKEEQEQALAELSCYLGIDTTPVRQKSLSYDEIMAVLDKYYFGRHEIKQLIVEHVIESQYMSSQGFVLFFYGPPGTGKTRLALALCEIFGCQLIRTNCGTSGSISFQGTPQYYNNARLSAPIEMIRDNGSDNVLWLVDEFDDMVKDEGGTGYSSFVELLESSEYMYHDSFCNAYFRLPNARIVITANDEERIPAKIRNRLAGKKVVFEGYSEREKLEIGQLFIVPRELEARGFSAGDIRFTDSAMRLIVCEYCDDEGARELIENIQTILRKVRVGYARDMIKLPFVVDDSYVREQLESKKSQRRFVGFGA